MNLKVWIMCNKRVTFGGRKREREREKEREQEIDLRYYTRVTYYS